MVAICISYMSVSLFEDANKQNILHAIDFKDPFMMTVSLQIPVTLCMFMIGLNCSMTDVILR